MASGRAAALAAVAVCAALCGLQGHAEWTATSPGAHPQALPYAAAPVVFGAAHATVSPADGSPPTFQSADYYTGNRTLHLAFSEALNGTVHPDRFNITAGNSPHNTALSGSSHSVAGSSLVLTLLQGHHRAIVLEPGSRLGIGAGAVYDAAGNPVASSANHAITRHETRPVLTSADYYTGNGTLAAVFSLDIDSGSVNATGFLVRGLSPNWQVVEVRLDAAQLYAGNTNGTKILFVLNQANRDTVSSMIGTPMLNADAEAVRDTKGIYGPPSGTALFAHDTAPPEFSSATYYVASGTLAVSFSEALNGTAHLPKLHVRVSGSDTGGVTAGPQDAKSASGAVLNVTFAEARRPMVAALGTSIELDIDADAVYDAAGNGIVRDYLGNTITVVGTMQPTIPTVKTTPGQSAARPPSPPNPMVLMSAEYYSSVGLLVAEFGGVPAAGRVHHHDIAVLGVLDGDAFTLPLRGSDHLEGADPRALVYRPGNLDAVSAMRAPVLLAAGANGTGPVPITVGDVSPPGLEWAAYSPNSGDMALAFNETLGSADGALLSVYGDGLEGVAANATASGYMVYVKPGPAARAVLDGAAHPYVLVDAGAVADLSGNPVPRFAAALKTHGIIGFPDSAWYRPGSGVLAVLFDGIPGDASVDTSRIYVREHGRDEGGVVPHSYVVAPAGAILLGLDEEGRLAVDAMALPYVHMVSGAVSDERGNASPEMPGVPIWVAENGRPIAAAYDRGSGALAVLLNGEPAGNYTMRVKDARGHWGISLDADDAAAPGVASYPLGAEHLDVLAGAGDARLQVGAGAVTGIEGERTLTASVPVEVVPGLDAQRLPDRAAYMVHRTALYGAIIQDGPEPGRVTLAVVCDGAATVLGLNLTASANDAEDRYAIFGDSVRAGAVPLGNPRHASTDAGLDAPLVPGGVAMLPHVALTVPVNVLDLHDGQDSILAASIDYMAAPGSRCDVRPALAGPYAVGFVNDAAGSGAVSAATLLAVEDFNGYVARLGQTWHVSLDSRDASGGHDALKAVRDLESPPAILGPSGDGNLWAVLYQTSADRSVVVSCCSGSAELAAPDHVFRMVPGGAGQAEALGALAAGAADHVIVAYADDAAGHILRDAAAARILERDARVSWVPYGGDAESAAAAIAGATRPGESTAAVILHPEPADTVRATGAGISWYGMEGMLGEPGMPEGATAVRPGVWSGTLAERLGLPPEGESAARAYRAYDAAFALGVAVLGAQSHDPEALLQALLRVSDIAPAKLGHLNFDQNGDLAVTEYAVWTVADGAWTAAGWVKILEGAP